MRRPIARWLMAGCLLLSVFSASAAEDVVKAAEAAIVAGEHEKALSLYDQVLASAPQNREALLRSAQLLSWKKDFDQAVERYELAIAINPTDIGPIVERAKVLSWARRYRESIDGFRAALKLDSENKEARLGLARTLSWSGQLPQARAEYETILARTPNDAEALAGVGQTYAWSGDQAGARTWYERATAVDPAQLSANLGLAYVDLAAGNRTAASRRAAELALVHPTDKDVLDLNSAVRGAMRPRAEVSHERNEDSDDNELGVSRVRVTFPLPTRSEMSLSVARFAMDSGVRDGSVDTAHLQSSIRVSQNNRLTLRGGVDRSERSDGTRKTTPTGAVSWATGDERRLLLLLVADRDTFKYSVPILDAGIEVDSLGARVNHASRRWLLDAGGSKAEFSDDNRRDAYDGVLLFRWPGRALNVATGVGYRFLDFERAANRGYFDPQDYKARTLQLRIGRSFASRFEFNISAESGLQSFVHRGVVTEDDNFAAGAATVSIPLGRSLLLDLGAAKSQSAISAASGFESTQYTVRFRVQQ